METTRCQGCCVMGDLNEIVTNDEKEGCRPRRGNQMVHFREALKVGDLHDIG